MKFYLVYKNNGLYDPVLDDQEPIFESIDPEGFDRPSQPTEVFHIQQFLDPNNLDYYDNQDPNQLNTFGDIKDPNRCNASCELDDPSRILLGDPKLSESRSLTASPFVLTTKPYRPFSTEPVVDIPALEDPIILNPNYSDEFGKSTEGDGMVQTKFKLPVSEQYDPDWKRKEQEKLKGEKKKITDMSADVIDRKEVEYTNINIKSTESLNQVTKTTEEFKVEQMTREEIEFTKKMKQEIDIDKIEMTATNIVNESIEKAMTVAEEIKKELDVELFDNNTNVDIKEIETELNTTKQFSEYKTKDYKNESYEVKTEYKSESAESNSKSVSETVSKEPSASNENVIVETDNVDVKVAKMIEKFDTAEIINESIEQRRLSAKQDVEEIIETGSVKRKSMIFDKETEVKENIETKDSKNQAHIQGSNTFESSEKTSQSKISNKMSTSRLLAEQRAYTIGLQTIPNIRGSIHSNYHYNLLLKTFFIHLTDVMVALSRFILTEPVFSDSEETKEIITQEKTVENVDESIKNLKREQKVEKETEKKDIKKDMKYSEQLVVNKGKAQEDKIIEKSIIAESKEVKEDIQEKKITSKLAKTVEQVKVKEDKVKLKENIEEVNNKVLIEGEERRKSGSKMAQLSEKKSEELTTKMDAVITEFENKTGIEEAGTQLRNRRSRSRSQVEEEVMKESDPLEWLAKRDSRSSSQEITELKTSTKSFSSTSHSSQKKIESRESNQITATKLKDKQMYVAIVEAHVFTNKDAIFEETTEFSETASVQSADEVNTAIECNEAMSTENVTIECKKQRDEEVAHFLVEEPHVTSSAIKTKEAEVQVSKEAVQDIKEIVQEIAHNENVIETQIYNKNEIENIDIKKEQLSIKKESLNKSVSESKSEFNIVESKKEKVEIQELIDESTLISVNEEVSTNDSIMQVELAEEEKEQAVDLDVSADVKVEKVTIKEKEPQEEAAHLKIIKEEVIELEKPAEIKQEHQTKVIQIEESLDLSKQDMAVSLSKFVDISQSSSCETVRERTDYTIKEVTEESSFTAKSVESSSLSSQKLTLRTDLAQQIAIDRQTSVQSDENNNIDTPTPSTMPPTPLTDEYVFKLQIPLPKNARTAPIQEDEDPDIVKKEDFHEDPNIVKKKLVPHIETNLESPIIYDPPLPSPPGEKVTSPVYTKPGLRGGADRQVKLEEILEIERKSSLLASAIDETIKSIEEYKEQAGIETKMDVDSEENTKIEYTAKTESYTKENNTIKHLFEAKMDHKTEEEWSKIDKQITDNADSVTELSKSSKIDVSQVEEEQTKCSLNIEVNTTSEVKAIKQISNANEEISKSQDLQTEKNVTAVGIKLEEPICDSVNDLSKISDNVLENTTNGILDINNEVNQTLIDVKQDKFDNKMEDTDNNEIGSIERNVYDSTESTFKFNNTSESTITTDEAKTKENLDEERKDPLQGFRSVVFNPEEIVKHKHFEMVQEQAPEPVSRLYMTPTGEILGTVQGIVDGLEDATVDDDVAKELGKPGMTEEKIAELISGESEMLREAHVMGLSRVLTSHMNRTIEDDSSVDFKKIKPIVESLHNSEVLKALNEELVKTKEEKKKEERKWTTFLQKPKRPVPKAKFGYYAYVEPEEAVIEEPYKVKIVKQPKPKVAPDYKPENFDTGPLPWEERAFNEPTPPPIEAEEPILVPEEVPEFLEAVDPLPESEVPDLEDTGITLPPPEPIIETTEPVVTIEEKTENAEEEPEEPEVVAEEKKEATEDMEENQIARQLISSVQGMVDPNATLEQQLAQMRAQLAALAQLPGVIQQTLEMVTRQLTQISMQETQSMQVTQQNSQQTIAQIEAESNNENEENSYEPTIIEEVTQNGTEENNQEQNMIVDENANVTEKQSLTQEEMEKLRKEEVEMLEEQRRIEKQKKEIIEQMKQEQESRQIKQRSTPRVGKPKPVFGPSTPQERPLVLPGGRKWRGPKDAYNEQLFTETLTAQAELIQGKTKGLPYESVLLPYDERINFMKYEKPPVSLDHLQHSDVYKLVHNMDQAPVRRVEMLTPVMAEADYREKCRSVSPCVGRMQKEQHLDIPQQLQP